MPRPLRNRLYSLWDVVWIETDRILSTLRSRFCLWFQGCAVGHGLRTTGPCHFKVRQPGAIHIGRHARLLAGWRSNRVGITGRLMLTTLGDGRIEIGDHFGGSGIVLSSRSLIRIGNHVNFGGNVRVYDHDFHSLDAEIRRTEEDTVKCKTKPVVIGDDVFVGANSIILKGVELGDRVIVGAGSVVTRSFPENSIIAGNPATLIREIPKTI
jgi:acetyltransferase-like isoleucine patch superfamily enzyme